MNLNVSKLTLLSLNSKHPKYCPLTLIIWSKFYQDLNSLYNSNKLKCLCSTLHIYKFESKQFILYIATHILKSATLCTVLWSQCVNLLCNQLWEAAGRLGELCLAPPEQGPPVRAQGWGFKCRCCWTCAVKRPRCVIAKDSWHPPRSADLKLLRLARQELCLSSMCVCVPVCVSLFACACVSALCFLLACSA